jgi:hypothetical protein
MFTARDFFDMRDTKFTVRVIYPPEKQQFMEDMLLQKAAADRFEVKGTPQQITYVFTLDEALKYFKSMKEAQDMVLAEKTGEMTGA